VGCVRYRGLFERVLAPAQNNLNNNALISVTQVTSMPSADVYPEQAAFPLHRSFRGSSSHVRLKRAPPRSSSGSCGVRRQALPVPQALFVASDSTNLRRRGPPSFRAPAAWGAVLGLPGPLADPPPLLSVDQSQRFVAQHGSHTVSSEGACTAAGAPAVARDHQIQGRAGQDSNT